jgi:hypothetical protein
VEREGQDTRFLGCSDPLFCPPCRVIQTTHKLYFRNFDHVKADRTPSLILGLCSNFEHVNPDPETRYYVPLGGKGLMESTTSTTHQL